MSSVKSPISFTAVHVKTVNFSKDKNDKTSVKIQDKTYSNLVLSRDEKTGKVKLEELSLSNNKNKKRPIYADHVEIPVVDNHSILHVKDNLNVTIGKIFESAMVRIMNIAKATIGSVSDEATLNLNDRAKVEVSESSRNAWIYMHEGSDMRLKTASNSHIIMSSKDDQNEENYKKGQKIASPTAWVRNLNRGSVLYLTDKAKAMVIMARDDFTVEMAKSAEAFVHFLEDKIYTKPGDPRPVVELKDQAILKNGGLNDTLNRNMPITYMDKETKIIDEKGNDISKEFKPFREAKDEEASFEFMKAVYKNNDIKKSKHSY